MTSVLLLGVRAYRRLFAGRPSPCRFLPTCSAYAEEALHTHGAARGTWLTLRRLGRCRPGGGFGHDPVPACPSNAVPSTSPVTPISPISPISITDPKAPTMFSGLTAPMLPTELTTIHPRRAS